MIPRGFGAFTSTIHHQLYRSPPLLAVPITLDARFVHESTGPGARSCMSESLSFHTQFPGILSHFLGLEGRDFLNSCYSANSSDTVSL
jgi:hypothetical protein